MDKEKVISGDIRNSKRNQNLIIFGLLIISVFLSILYRFIQDDAFITFIYSRNLTRGEGLTWFGNYVEGYTNFLWVLWIAIGFIFKLEPVLWSYISGIMFFVITVYFTWNVANKIFKSPTPSILTILFLITNYSMVCYATSGMETMMQAGFVILIVLFYYRLTNEEKRRKYDSAVVSVIASLALLTRLDSAIPVFIIYIFVLIYFVRNKKKFSDYFYLFFPFVVIIGLWFGWKLFYYGSILPNSYYAKLGNGSLIQTIGIKYIYRFFQWYLIWPFIFFGIISHFFMKKFDRKMIPLISIVIVWIFYIYYTGGDFMEFRFFIPVLPLIFLIVTYSIFNFVTNASKKTRIIFVSISSVLIIFSSFLHSISFKGLSEDNCLDSISALESFYGMYPENNWDRIGKVLKNEFENKKVTIAVGPVGAIVYYSELETIDMLGLNNKDLVGNYKLKSERYKRPGHKLIVKPEYLVKKKVSFIIGHPNLMDKDSLSLPGVEENLMKWFNNIFRENEYPFKEITFLGVPIDEKEILVVVYLTKTPELDRQIQEKKYETKTVLLN